jgi:hypothetical protein
MAGYLMRRFSMTMMQVCFLAIQGIEELGGINFTSSDVKFLSSFFVHFECILKGRAKHESARLSKTAL